MPQTDPVILQRLDDIDDMLENIDHAIRGNGPAHDAAAHQL